MDLQQQFDEGQSRRRMLKRFGALASTGLALDLGLSQVGVAEAVCENFELSISITWPSLGV